jgi:hypothetical protein
MKEETADLFIQNEEEKCADDYAMELEERAAELEITVDYYIAEFL